MKEVKLEADMLEIRIDNEAKIISDKILSKVDDVINEIEDDFEIEDENLLDGIISVLLRKIKTKTFSI